MISAQCLKRVGNEKSSIVAFNKMMPKLAKTLPLPKSTLPAAVYISTLIVDALDEMMETKVHTCRSSHN